MSIKLEHVQAITAVERLYIYARKLNATEKDTLAHTILTGGTVTYAAYDNTGQFIGHTKVTPEDGPAVVTLVTEENF